VEVVGFFGADVSKVSPADQERLTALFQQSLTDALATKYQVVDQPAPGTVQLQVVILDAEAATPGLRSVSMAIPQARLLGTGYYAVSGKYPFVGGGALQTAAQWQWGDAENAIKAWSQLLADGMYAYTSGARKP
jgi:Protein of unknown function (DUF3313)